MIEDSVGYIHCDDCEEFSTGNMDWCACPCHHDTYPPDEIAESYKYGKEENYVSAKENAPATKGDKPL